MIPQPDMIEARKKCKELRSLRLTPYKARKTLNACGFAPLIVDEVMVEYEQTYKQDQVKHALIMRIVGSVAFFGGGGLFIYGIFGMSKTHYLFVFPFLVAAAWGFFRMLKV